MNGRINKHVFARMLRDLADEVQTTEGDSLSSTVASVKLGNLAAKVHVVASSDLPTAAARQALKEVGRHQIIQAIKRTRELSGCDLREAKEAVEGEIPFLIAAEIDVLTQRLQAANSKANWNKEANVSSATKRYLSR